MRSKLPTSAAFVALLGIGWLLGNQTSTNGQIPNVLNINQWEYKADNFSVEGANALGKDGWELVCVHMRRNGEERAVYKRHVKLTNSATK
jgi:hypothetical protein